MLAAIELADSAIFKWSLAGFRDRLCLMAPVGAGDSGHAEHSLKGYSSTAWREIRVLASLGQASSQDGRSSMM